jgi:hypothetical protein
MHMVEWKYIQNSVILCPSPGVTKHLQLVFNAFMRMNYSLWIACCSWCVDDHWIRWEIERRNGVRLVWEWGKLRWRWNRGRSRERRC